MKTIHELLGWRYAAKAFDTTKTLSAEDLEYILQAGNWAPTSYGLQPIKFIVVNDEAKKKALSEAAYGQVHVAENGALIVLAARTDVNEAMINEYVSRVESGRGMEEGSLDGFKQIMVGDLTSRTEEARFTWAQKQAYIPLMSMMFAAAEKGIDSCPMEGFVPASFDEILGLKEMNLSATVMLAVGYRSAEDKSQHYKKIRRDMSDIVVRI